MGDSGQSSERGVSKTLMVIESRLTLFPNTTANRANMSSSQSSQASSSSISYSDFGALQKRPATARMHAVSPRKKQRPGTQLPLSTALDETPHGTVKANIGECPPYNDHSAWIEDSFNNTIYVFGGTRPGDDDCLPTSDFLRCDTRTMKWEDLTLSFFFTGE